MDNETNNLRSKCNLKNLIKTKFEKGVKNIFDMLLVFELTKKRWGREGNVVLVIRESFSSESVTANFAWLGQHRIHSPQSIHRSSMIVAFPS